MSKDNNDPICSYETRDLHVSETAGVQPVGQLVCSLGLLYNSCKGTAYRPCTYRKLFKYNVLVLKRGRKRFDREIIVVEIIGFRPRALSPSCMISMTIRAETRNFFRSNCIPSFADTCRQTDAQTHRHTDGRRTTSPSLHTLKTGFVMFDMDYMHAGHT